MFEEGCFHGIGFVNIQEAEIYDFMAENRFITEAKVMFRYVGEWKQGRLSGSGKLVTKSEVYTGHFERGQFHGEGKLAIKDGKTI